MITLVCFTIEIYLFMEDCAIILYSIILKLFAAADWSEGYSYSFFPVC